MRPDYNPAICDLCGSGESTALVCMKTGRAMRSDRRIVNYDLEKYACARCGLGRSGPPPGAQNLQEFYADEYTLSEQSVEYFFHTPQGPVSRSALFCDWLVSAMGAFRWERAGRCLEVGAGAGMLMQEFERRFHGKRFEGVELNKAAVALARERGLAVSQGEPRSLEAGQFDLVYSIAVLEHVPSPTNFLQDLRRLLRPGGLLALCQPTQDVPSYDIFFADHLHHFGSEHLRQYARKGGFREQGLVVGHEWMPNFSLHFWWTDEAAADGFEWIGPPGYSTCAETARRIVADMARLDSVLKELREQRRRVAVFGLNEVYWLARSYSTLGGFPLVCGLDDTPNKPEYAMLGFPVLKPEECLTLGVEDVLLTMNKVYYNQSQQRLERLGLTVHRVLS